MKRKLLSVFLSLAMVLTMMPVFAMAEDTSVGGGTSDVNIELTESYTDKTGNVTYSTNDETVSYLNYSNGIMTVTGNNVTVKNVKFGDKAKLIVNTTGIFTLENCTFNPETVYGTEGSIRTAVTLNVGQAVVKDNKFGGVTDGYYNAIEFGIGDGQNNLSKAEISGNTFNSAIKNNYFNFYNMTDNAVIDISNNSLLLAAKTSNGIRISNPRNAKNITFNIDKDSYTYANDSAESEYEGLILLQDYSKDDAEQDFTNININITKLSAPENAKQLLYVYEDKSNSIINTNYPKLNGDDSMAQFYAAKIKDQYYKSLTDAYDDANEDENTEIVLLKDCTIDKGIEIKKPITLNLGNKTLSRNGSILDIYGNVTIKNGNIKIPSLEETSAVWVNQTAKLTVENNVTIDVPDNSFAIGYWSDCTTAEVNFKGSITGGNGITMNGNITNTDTTNNNILILDGAKINVSGHGVYQAGYSKTYFLSNNSEIRGVTGIEVRAGDLNVTNSIISGSTDKNKFSCKPNGNGTTTDGVGIAIAQHTTLPINVMISGGEISGVYAIYESNPQNNDSGSVKNVKLSVNNGKFTGDIYSEDITGFISGGYFTSDPTKYLATSIAEDEKYVAEVSDDPSYVYKVVPAAANDVPVVPAVGEVKVSGADKLEEAVKNAAKNVEAEKINVAAAEVARKISAEAAKKYIEDAKKETAGEAVNTPEKIEVRAYLDITPKAYSDGVNAVYTLEITPKYNIVVVGKENSADKKNEKVVGSGTLNVTNETNITIQLPAGFVDDIGTLYVQHKGHEYDATVTKKTEKGVDIYTALFKNPDGFSEFTISKNSQAVAKIGDKKYTSLQDAVDAVDAAETSRSTIEIVGGNTSKEYMATMTGSSKTITVKNSTNADKITVKVNGDSKDIEKNKTADFTYTRHSSSGSSTTTYTVTVGSVSNGTVTSSHKSAASGATVTLTVKPADGYAVEAVTAKDAKGNAVKVTEKDGKYTFAMPASNVTVSASFVKKGEQPAAKLFDDVAQGVYYYDAVKWAVDKGVTNGKTSNLFGSDDPCTRAQIVTFLWRAAGSPAASASVSFTDVKDSDYYAKAVAWAVEKGITNGTGDGKFSSDDTCTRAQCAAFLYRAAGSPEVTDAAAFSDVAADAYYAKAVAWAEKNGITNGLGNGKFGSDNSCTRAQIITFLYRTYQGK